MTGMLAISGGGHAAAGSANRTKVRIFVTGCEGCGVAAYNFRTQRSFGTRAVSDGKVTFRVPRKQTKGLGFFVESNRPDADYSAKFLAVARYGTKSPGSVVTSEEAASSETAAQCWAGTKRKKQTLRLTVEHIPGQGPTGDPVMTPRSYFTPSLKSFGTPWETFNGVLATQTVIDCSG
jgi:hypothetical protein